MKESRNIFIGIPSHNGQIHGDIIYSILDAAMSGEKIAVAHQSFSLLARNFNHLLADAINGKYSHFVLLHADIIPGKEWLQKMLSVMDEKKCDVLSVISPRKNPRGLTSTAILKGQDPFRAKLLTMKDVSELPETFEREDLLVNSGLLLIDLRASWVGSVWFEIKDDVENLMDGTYKPFGISEDWLFSMRARAAGARIFATRAVKIRHIGSHAFTNDPADWEIKK